jgi:hypothetical protein
MLFVGTYTDITICGYEGCPPVYSDSISLLNFDWDLLPQNAIVMDAKLNLYHYGSSDYSENYAIKVSGISAVWQNNTILPGPEIVEDFGQTEIPYFNTSIPNNIQLREININPEFFDQDNFENGVALRPVDGDQYAGIVFCSGDSVAFCDARYKPTLSLTYIPNNPPSKPQITFPENNKVFGGECDETIYPLTAKCTDLVEINFNSTNTH